jgi:hypothetical protein
MENSKNPKIVQQMLHKSETLKMVSLSNTFKSTKIGFIFVGFRIV